MAFSLFRRKKEHPLERKFNNFSTQLAQAFAQIKTDLSEVSSRIDSNQKDMERLYQWIDYLNRHTQRLSDNNSRLSQKYDHLADNHAKLHDSHQELNTSHSAALEATQQLQKSHKQLSEDISEHKNKLKSEISEEILAKSESSFKEVERLKAWIDYFAAYVERQKVREGALKEDISQVQKGWLERYSSLRELLNGLKMENGELKGHVFGLNGELDNTKEQLQNALTALETRNNDLEEARKALESAKKQMESVKIGGSGTISQSIPAKSEDNAGNRQVFPQGLQSNIIRQAPQIVQVASPSHFQKHIMSRVMPNRKGYVIKFMMDMISNNSYSTKDLEQVVVGEKQLCGRTSFYAYLKELKLKNRIDYAEIDERTILVSTDTQQTLAPGPSPEQ